MRFYTESHEYYCGVDLHSRNLYAAIRDKEGNKCFHKRLPNCEERFLKMLAPYRSDVVVAVESTYNWYWLADLCAREQIPFVLGHAQYMKAIHQGKSKNDRIDSDKVSLLTLGKLLPQSYVYPREMRMTRDLLRRRLYFTRTRAALKGHIEIVASQYNIEPLNGAANYKSKRNGIVENFSHNDLKCSIAADLVLVDNFDPVINSIERYLVNNAKVHNREVFELLQTVTGVGHILSLTFLYEIHDIERFGSSQCFCSYGRLVNGSKSSNKKPVAGASSGKKIGNPHLKWAFSEAAVQMLKHSERVRKWYEGRQRKYGKAGAYSRLSHKIGKTVYYLWKHGEVFNEEKFLSF